MREHLFDLAGDDRAFAAELLETYLRTTPHLLKDMQQALRAADAVQLGQAAHTMKSSTAYLGLDTLYGLCREIEQATLDGSTAGSAELVQALQQTFEADRPLLERECAVMLDASSR